MAEEKTAFDFTAWLNQPRRHSFHSCLRAAVDCLALDDGNLRERIVGAIFCLNLCREEDIPERWRREVRGVSEAVKLRGEGGATLGVSDLDYGGLTQWAPKCKLRTARRIARIVMKIHRAMNG